MKRRQPAPSARAARRPQTDSTSGAAKQAAPRRICCTEMALSPPRIGSTASDPTCTRNTSSTSRSQMCARECTHPLRAIVRAGVQGWVLEQGEGSHNRGQQLVVHMGMPGAPSTQRTQPVLLLDAPQQRPARNPQAGHISAASAQDGKVDIIGAHSTRRSTSSSIILAAGSGARARLEAGGGGLSVGFRTGRICNTSSTPALHRRRITGHCGCDRQIATSRGVQRPPPSAQGGEKVGGYTCAVVVMRVGPYARRRALGPDGA